MKKIIKLHVFFVTLLLLKSYSSEFAGRIEVSSATVGWPSTPPLRWTSPELHRKLPLASSEQRRLTDLNIDVLFQIIDKLPIVDLLNLVKTNSHLSFLAGDLFRRKYRNYEIKILRTDLLEAETIYDVSDSERIEIYGLQSTTSILRLFGHAIKHLEIRTQNIDKSIAMSVSRLVNKFCSESLTHLNLNYIKEDTFVAFTAPFRNIKELSFSIDKSVIINGVLTLNRLFPQLQRLKIGFYSDADIKFIDCHFPYLNHLEVVASKHAWQHRDQIEALIRKNPQIQRVSLKRLPIDIKSINQLLPKLEDITIDKCCFALNAMVYFDNVRNLNLPTQFPHCIEKIAFPRLESLKLQYSPDFLDAWVDFFKKHNNLTRLTFGKSFSFWHLPLLKLTADLDGLVDVTIESAHNIDVDTISQFIETHSKLVNFQFQVIHSVKEDDFNWLQKRFEGEWHIQDIKVDSGRVVKFERIFD